MVRTDARGWRDTGGVLNGFDQVGKRRNHLTLLTVFVSFAVTLSGCGGSGRGRGATPDPPPMETGAAMALVGVLQDSNSPAIARYGARLPAPGAVTCKALTIRCEGGLGPIHYRSIGKRDFSDFDYRERRRGVSLVERTGVSGGDGMTDHRAWAGWINHSLFVIETPPPSEGRPGRLYHAFSMGNTRGSNPHVLVDSTATWSGVMFGLRISDPDAFVHGDALVRVSNTDGDLVVDVEFTNIKDEDTGAGLDDVSWSGLELRDGSFGVVPVAEDAWHVSRHPASEGISGRFYGSNHEEVGGLFGFTKSVAGGGRFGGYGYGVSGVFGTKRDQIKRPGR